MITTNITHTLRHSPYPIEHLHSFVVVADTVHTLHSQMHPSLLNSVSCAQPLHGPPAPVQREKCLPHTFLPSCNLKIWRINFSFAHRCKLSSIYLRYTYPINRSMLLPYFELITLSMGTRRRHLGLCTTTVCNYAAEEGEGSGLLLFSCIGQVVNVA